tara:strand:- start:46 stop:465 length:420 start_codon:yes stop_codon:yes gene_type:complete
MNSLLSIRNTLTQTANDIINDYNSTTGSSVGVTFDNSKAFDPFGYEHYVGCFFIPAANEQVGKRGTPEEDEGIYQMSVFVEGQSGSYDLKQLEIIDAIRTGFRNAELGNLSISDINVNGGRYDESWFVRDVSVNVYVLS